MLPGRRAAYLKGTHMHTLSTPGTMPWPTLRAVLLAERGESPAAAVRGRRRPFWPDAGTTALFLVTAIAVVTMSIVAGLVASS